MLWYSPYNINLKRSKCFHKILTGTILCRLSWVCLPWNYVLSARLWWNTYSTFTHRMNVDLLLVVEYFFFTVVYCHFYFSKESKYIFHESDFCTILPIESMCCTLVFWYTVKTLVLPQHVKLQDRFSYFWLKDSPVHLVDNIKIRNTLLRFYLNHIFLKNLMRQLSGIIPSSCKNNDATFSCHQAQSHSMDDGTSEATNWFPAHSGWTLRFLVPLFKCFLSC